MRLIDADKLPYVNKVILVDKSDGDVIITIAKEYTSYVNDETPTVEAIPIEWLKQHIKELDTELHSLYSRFRSQGDSKEKNEALLSSITFRTTLTAYETVLSEWEKENE